MGCLKFLIRAVIITLAVIGFLAIGGREFVKEHVIPVMKNFSGNFSNELKNKDKAITDLTLNELKDLSLNSAKKTIKSETIDGDYEITQIKGLFGYDAVIAQDKNNGQKMVVVDTKNKLRIDLTQTDKVRLKKDMLNLVKKQKNISLRFDDIDITDRGKWEISGEEQNYVTISVKDKISGKNIEAIVSAKDSNSSEIYITFAPKEVFSAENAKKYWR